MRFLYTCCVVMGWLLAAGGIAYGEIPREPPAQGDTLQAVLDRIHEHAQNDQWRQGGWQDSKIEAWLDRLVSAVARGAEMPRAQAALATSRSSASGPGPARDAAGIACHRQGLQAGSWGA